MNMIVKHVRLLDFSMSLKSMFHIFELRGKIYELYESLADNILQIWIVSFVKLFIFTVSRLYL